MSAISSSVDSGNGQYSDPDFSRNLGRPFPKITGSPLYNKCLEQFNQSHQVSRKIAEKGYGTEKAMPLVKKDPILSQLKDLKKNEKKSDTNYSRHEHQFKDHFSLEYWYTYQLNEMHTLFRCLGIMFKMNSQVLTEQTPVSFKVHHLNGNQVTVPEQTLLSLYLNTAVRLHRLAFDLALAEPVTDTRSQSFIAINRRMGEIVRLSIVPSYTSPYAPLIPAYGGSGYRREPQFLTLEISSIEAIWEESEVRQWKILPPRVVLAGSGDNCYNLARYFFDTVQQNDEDAAICQEALKPLPTVCQSLVLSYFGPEVSSEASLHIQPPPSSKKSPTPKPPTSNPSPPPSTSKKSCIVQ